MKLPNINKVEFVVEPEPEYEDIADDLDEKDHADYIQYVRDNIDYNIWLWCCVKVTATYKGFEGVDYLCCCCYESEEDFINNSGYFEDMKQQAYNDLISNIESEIERVKEFM